jgi:hypothetical protein
MLNDAQRAVLNRAIRQALGSPPDDKRPPAPAQSGNDQQQPANPKGSDQCERS